MRAKQGMIRPARMNRNAPGAYIGRGAECIRLIILALLLLVAVLASRYLLLRRALRQAERDLAQIDRDLSQNRILHLSAPDRDMERLMRRINATLEGVRAERVGYEKRERALQAQIENISHDLRTPLTVILGYIRLLKDGKGDVQEKQNGQMLDVIERKARGMQALVAQFYDYARISASDYVLTVERVDAGRLLREALADAYGALDAAGLEVEAALPEHPCPVHGDAAAMERVFQNLLQNAARYGHRFLRVSAQEEGDGFAFVLENGAPGMTGEEATRLFERFYIQDAARGQSGTGLGLTIAAELVQQMGGSLEAEVLGEKEQAVLRFTLRMKRAAG